jgi:ABC-type Fe3+ transport system substrate-binding protein
MVLADMSGFGRATPRASEHQLFEAKGRREFTLPPVGGEGRRALAKRGRDGVGGILLAPSLRRDPPPHPSPPLRGGREEQTARSSYNSALAGLALLLVSITAAAAENSDWSTVVDAAKKEGKVVVYNMALGAPYYVAVVKAFEQKYGISVESLDLRASELVERLRTEHAAGRFLGDTELISSTMIEEQVGNGDHVQKLGAIPNAAALRPPFRQSEVSVPAYVQAVGILVNTRMVKPEDEPRSWRDLVDPRWRGKMLSDDMRPLGSGNTVFAVLQNALGASFNEKLAEQKPVFSRDMRNDARRVARGEYPLYITQILAFTSDLKGLPVKAVVPQEGAVYATMEFAVLKNAPHPNAARLLINHFLESRSQLTYANAWMVPVVRDVVEQVQEDAKPFAAAKLLGSAKLAERPAMMELAKRLYK